MSDSGPKDGWWQASDGNWYPPEQHPDNRPNLPPPPPPPPSRAASGRRARARNGAQLDASVILAWLGVAMYLGSMVIDGYSFGWSESLEWGLGYEVLRGDYYENWEKLSWVLVHPGVLLVLLALAVNLTIQRNRR